MQPTHSLRLHVYSLRMSVRASDDYTFDLHSREKRDHCLAILRAAIDKARRRESSGSSPERPPVASSLVARPSLDEARSEPVSSDPQNGRESTLLDAWIKPDADRPSPVLPPEYVVVRQSID